MQQNKANLEAGRKRNTLKKNQTIKIDKSTALLGHHDDAMSSTDLNTINHLIAIAKMCISKFRYGEIKQIKLIF